MRDCGSADHHALLGDGECLKKHMSDIAAQSRGKPNAHLGCLLVEAAEEPGPLRSFLARLWDHGGQLRPSNAALVVSRLAGLASIGAERGHAAISEALAPLATWQHGIEPVLIGLERILPRGGSFDVRREELAAMPLHQLLLACWQIGTHKLAHDPRTTDPDGDPLGFLASPIDGAALLTNIDAAFRECIGQTADTLGLRVQSTSDVERLPVDHGIVSAYRHKWLSQGQDEAAYQMAAHAAAERAWPSDCPANDRVQQKAHDLGLGGFWAEQAPMACGPEQQWRVRFLTCPWTILMLGTSFDTCLRINGEEEVFMLGWAMNANLRVAVVATAEGFIVGRRGIGLTLGDTPGVVHNPTYPAGNAFVINAIDGFVDKFLRENSLRCAARRNERPENTCARAYGEWDAGP